MADTSRILLTHWSLKYQWAKTCRFLSVKLFLKRWLHWNITAATNGDKMKHINLGHQNCNQPVQREEEIISSILFSELFQTKIHRSSKTLNYVLLLWFVTEQLNHVWCYCCPRLWWWFQCTVTRDGCVCSALAAVSDNCAGGGQVGGVQSSGRNKGMPRLGAGVRPCTAATTTSSSVVLCRVF